MDNGDNDLSFIYKYMKKNCHKHARQYHHHIYREREKRNGEKMTTFFSTSPNSIKCVIIRNIMLHAKKIIKQENGEMKSNNKMLMFERE